jgi:hypothetical protein
LGLERAERGHFPLHAHRLGFDARHQPRRLAQ